MAQKRMLDPLKLSSCAGKGRGPTHDGSEANPRKPTVSPKATQASKLRQTLETAKKMVQKIQVDLLYCLRKQLTGVPRLMLKLRL